MKAYHKFISGLLTACMTLTCFPAVLANAEDVPDAVEWNGHKYAVIQQELTPIEANQYCQSLGGYLATITSADEQAFVAYLASQVDWEAFFIGGSDENSEGEWYWLNGETWDYTAWYPGGAVGKTEPNNGYGAGENYVLMDRSREYQWVDVFGGYDNHSTRTYFICEWGELEDTTKSTWNGHTYQYFDTGMTWDEAKEYCENLGGHLATVTSEEEEAVIEALVENGTRNVYWLGGKTTNLVFTWITGENTSYTHWSSGQPDNWGKGDCIEYQRANAGGVSGHGWGDTDNAGEYFGLKNTGFICEWDDVPSNTVIWNNHVYQFFDTGITWDKAKKYCENLGGHLATITSAEEQAQIEKLIANGTKNNYWLGGNIENYELSWITGESVDYTNWASGQPDNYQNDDCLEILRVQDASLMPYHWCDTNRNAVVDNFDSAFFGVENFGFICEWEDNSAITVPEVTLMGDANNDGEFSLVDIVLLQKWLLNKSDAHLGNWKNVDFNQDGRINIFDFCLMKRELLTVPEPEVLATNFNIYTVQNTPSAESTFTVDKTCKIYSLMTYHWNYGSGTQETGTITLLEDGRTLVTWSTSGAEGMYSTPNACWWAYPENLVLTSGHVYTIVDSDPETWSQNGGSDYAGFFEVQGSYIGAVG